jgi:RNA polymerase sigma-70 factor (ECF subfamily)
MASKKILRKIITTSPPAPSPKERGKNFFSFFPTFYSICTLYIGMNVLKASEVIFIDTVERAKRGDNPARAALFRQYSKTMYNICLRMCGNKNDAEDILQEAFIIAFNELKKLNDNARFGGWLRTITINECIRYTKSMVLWSDLEQKHEEAGEYEEYEWYADVDFNIIHQEIKGLPDGCRQVFNLYVLEDYTHKQIAESLNITESTSKTQYMRARLLLKDRIKKQLQLNG